MKRLIPLGLVVLALAFHFVPVTVASNSIVDTRHNLSITGPGPVRSTTEGEVCVFCHVPHHARRDIPYLWNRNDSTANYIPYSSTTLQATVGQPTGASKLCLSCHDGTIALGALINRPQEVPFAGGIRFIPEGRARLGTDLSDDHPVSFVYDSGLASLNPELANPSTLPPEVRLDRNNELQCTACHDPHDDSNGKFLVMPNQYSALCTTCHSKDGWPQSSHATSGRSWNGIGASPWFGSPYPTVAENGCANCHVTHMAGGHQRLMNYAVEEDNCLVCHNGNAATHNISGELTKPFGHFVQNYFGVHDPAENFTVGGVQKHVECADCHDPHQSNATPSLGAPSVSGATLGASGIDTSGQAVRNARNEYEICFKCHGDNNFVATPPITRQLHETNTRLEFDLASPSSHPVTGPRNNPNVPSLLAPYTSASVILCTDCHGNDDAFGPKGPHGSMNRYLLSKNYITADNTTETPAAYELCYSCHSRSSILADQSFKRHRQHIVDVRAPCSACHDAHGVSSVGGNPINNAHLINFDLSIVQPDSQGRLYYEKTGIYKGTCYLSCHGRNHNPRNY